MIDETLLSFFCFFSFYLLNLNQDLVGNGLRAEGLRWRYRNRVRFDKLKIFHFHWLILIIGSIFVAKTFWRQKHSFFLVHFTTAPVMLNFFVEHFLEWQFFHRDFGWYQLFFVDLLILRVREGVYLWFWLDSTVGMIRRSGFSFALLGGFLDRWLLGNEAFFDRSNWASFGNCCWLGAILGAGSYLVQADLDTLAEALFFGDYIAYFLEMIMVRELAIATALGEHLIQIELFNHQLLRLQGLL